LLDTQEINAREELRHENHWRTESRAPRGLRALLSPSFTVADGPKLRSLVPVAVDGLSSGVQLVALGSSHGCAIDSNGTLKCWGGNFFGQLGDGTTMDRTRPVVVLFP